MLFSRTDKSFLGQWWWTVDRSILLAVFLLLSIGIILVTTASPPVAAHLGLGDFHFLIRHIVFLVPAVVMMMVVSMMGRRMIWRLSSLIYLGTIVAMIFVLMFGMEIKGAQRWLHVLGFSLQPSEFIKPAFAVVSAWFLAKHKQSRNENEAMNYTGYKIAAGFYALAITLLLMQPDLGMTVIVTCIFLTQIFLAGFPFRWIIGLGGLGVVGLISAYYGFHHVRSRIDRFLDPSSGDNYQVERSLEAFQNGGVFGTGPGQGEIKLLLPDAHADFIFSVAGEEMGLLFVLIVIGLYLFVIWRGLSRLMASQDIFAILAVGGLLGMFGLQALVHMGSSLHLLPAKGMTLPFISYGGSSLLSICLSMGIILSLTRREVKSSISRGGLLSFSKSKALEGGAA